MKVRDKVFIFWGCMDALAIVLYCAQSVRHDRIPFISDIHAFSTVVNTLSAGGYSALVILFFIFDFVLLVSLFASAWLFCLSKPFARRLALCQEFLRLVSFRCSVSLFPLALDLVGESNVWLNGILFIFSEFLKIYTLWIFNYERTVSLK
ncbi:TPA: hypothetical protein N2299_000710 [Enterobacter hormaechei]|uniref:Uncharacterized protein n=2 Tax=Enterobacter hormaechei TaxID=158836 RepID=A0ABD4JQV1_9ENTR|nr:hypothetical protein [Enterobacter hormaechei]AJB71321.1 hypothetical protein LI64_12520 [Enterobacter hormaechei subsp. hormaechei]EGK59942.1 hypothetical protein HMPREF9086_2702 [Enterobacter hormaechei ATCC 49162]UAS92837.1 hypothetical protein K9O84_12500 [Enterobacter cloacae complex sp.]EGQ5287784.1 hypothetical protein [Enterobacter hormaechei]EGQ5311699.1 hypothetical protein [Enterobacter hormaechei]